MQQLLTIDQANEFLNTLKAKGVVYLSSGAWGILLYQENGEKSIFDKV